MGAQCSTSSPTSCASDLKKPKPVDQLGHLPKTEQEARAEYIKILKEMEYRSVRAAKMAYEHSDEFEKKHLIMTTVMSGGALISTFLIGFFRKAQGGKSSLIHAGSLSVIAAAVSWIGFDQHFDTLLPLYYKKHIDYNKAGAGWQALEFKIRFDRALSLQKTLSLEDLRKKGFDFAKERKEICEIARPTVEKHGTYEKKYSDIIESKTSLLKAVEGYFEAVGDNKETEETSVTPVE